MRRRHPWRHPRQPWIGARRGAQALPPAPPNVPAEPAGCSRGCARSRRVHSHAAARPRGRPSIVQKQRGSQRTPPDAEWEATTAAAVAVYPRLSREGHLAPTRRHLQDQAEKQLVHYCRCLRVLAAAQPNVWLAHRAATCARQHSSGYASHVEHSHAHAALAERSIDPRVAMPPPEFVTPPAQQSGMQFRSSAATRRDWLLCAPRAPSRKPTFGKAQDWPAVEPPDAARGAASLPPLTMRTEPAAESAHERSE